MESKGFSPLPHKDIPMAIKGEGVYIYDSEGKRYLDGSSGAMTASLGHGLTEVIEKIKEQLDILTYTCRFQFNNQPGEELAKKITELAPDPLNKVLYVNSGSEATEIAIKLARSYWKSRGEASKTRILSRYTSYHGSTLGALSMTGHSTRRKEYQEYLGQYPVMEVPYCYHCPYEKEYPSCELFCARELESVIKKIGEENISAFIAEPIIGASGAGITPPNEYFPIIREICDKYNILLILDEVVTGFGRTGKNFACEHWDMVPDILVFGKGVSSGYGTLAGAICTEEIYQTIVDGVGSFTTGHTLGGNPLACAVGCSVIDYMNKYNVISQVEEKGEYLKQQLLNLQQTSSIIGDVRGKGLLIGVEFVQDKRDGVPFSREQKITERMIEICFKNGLNLYPSTGMIDGIKGDSILITPPLNISETEMDELVELFKMSIKELETELIKGGELNESK